MKEHPSAKITVSAPGKIHLMGEHAVVYGRPALLAAVDVRLYVTICSGKSGIAVHTTESDAYVRHVCDVVQQQTGIKRLPSVDITVSSRIPAGYHLGSSAALAVATTGALLYFLKRVWNPSLINKYAYEAEKKQHGNPSGGDNTACTYGGLLWFRKELEFLKSMWQLPFKPHKNLADFFLINTGKPGESTGEMVSLVAKRYKTHHAEMEKIFNRNEAATKKLTAALKEGNESALTDAVREGERTLEEMGVVSPKAAGLIRRIEKAGGAAKILGGGGQKDNVGFLLCYHSDFSRIKKVITHDGYPVQSVRLGEEGVRLETGKMNVNPQSKETQL